MAWKTRPPDALPVGIFMQDKIWVTADNEMMNLEDIEDGHLQNLIGWQKRNKHKIIEMINEKHGSGHLATWKWPLLKRLERIARDRDSAPGAVSSIMTEIDAIEFIKELNSRGYDIVKIPIPRKAKAAPPRGTAYSDDASDAYSQY